MLTKNPPQTNEVQLKTRDLIVDAGIISDIGYGGIVVAEGDQLDIQSDDSLEQPEPASDGFWWRIVLMDKLNGLATPIEHLDRVISYQFRIRIDLFQPEKINFTPKKFLEGRHADCFKVLENKDLELVKAKQITDLKRDWVKRVVFTDEQKRFKFMTAQFSTTLGPTT